MLIQMIRFVLILAGAVGGYYGYQSAADMGWQDLTLNRNSAIIIYMILGSAIGYVVGGVVGRLLSRTLARVEDALQNVPIFELLLGAAGLTVGLIIAFLATLPLALIEVGWIKPVFVAFVYTLFAWLGLRVGAGRRDDLRRILRLAPEPGAAEQDGRIADKLLDTNIIVDGRVLDVARAGFIDGRLILPRFVLEELQLIADSEDQLKRGRGRRGLDVLSSLQQELGGKIVIQETDYPAIRGVDAKLVRLARETGAALFTNDYNLGKIARLEGVKVMNLNDLAHALKSVVLPGEEMTIGIVRAGKEPGQGVGYLDDGTMVVVEEGERRVGETVEVQVTSALQTPVGKMIFTKMKVAGPK
jgi:uncharacterized protein YacL